MAKVTGPILSLSARGQIGKTQVYAQWRGVPYARAFVVPGNPNTVLQQETRNTFRTLQEVFKVLSAEAQGVWLESIKGRALTARNQHVKTNLASLKGATNMQQYLASPGVGGGPPISTVILTPGVGQVTVAITPGSLPTGWTITRAVALAFKDQNPALTFASTPVSGVDLTSPYSIVLTGLTAGLTVVSAWVEFARADASFAASISKTGVTTVT